MTRKEIAAYGVLGGPLAMAALPVYIHTPRLYGDEFGLGLALTGLVLLFSRVIDTMQDPWLGKLADSLHARQGGWKWLMLISVSVLILSYVALFNPPERGTNFLLCWFVVTLVLVYTAHSALNITYLAWGAKASDNSLLRTQLVVSREGFALAGVVLASLLPVVLLRWFTPADSWLAFSCIFAFLILPSIYILLNFAPPPRVTKTRKISLLDPLRVKPFRRLAILFLLNGFAIAIAATLSLFYISDVLQLDSYSGIFLAVYFMSGACSLPLWFMLSKQFGKCLTWIMGSLLAVTGFAFAVQLGSGDLYPYLIICLFSGMALGADLSLPPAIAADLIPENDKGQTASYFGIWSLINKFVLALSAGLTLPFLAFLGYKPGGTDGIYALAILYAGIPSFIKVIAVVLIFRWRKSLEAAKESYCYV